MKLIFEYLVDISMLNILINAGFMIDGVDIRLVTQID